MNRTRPHEQSRSDSNHTSRDADVDVQVNAATATRHESGQRCTGRTRAHVLTQLVSRSQ